MVFNELIGGAAGGAVVSIVIKAHDQFSKVMDDASSKTAKLNAAGKIAGIGLAAVATGMVAFGAASARAATAAQPIEAQFKKLAVGSDSFLASLNAATKGTVSNFELMSSANKALLLGLDQNKLPNLFEKAAILGQAAGRSVTEAVEDITLGIGRQSKLILDNLGIMVDAEGAYDSYAKSIGKTASQLSDLEKKEAFFIATSEAMDKKIKDSGMVFEETFSTKLAHAQASMQNFQVEMGNALLPGLTDLMENVIANKDTFIELGKAITIVMKGVLDVINEVVQGVATAGAVVGNTAMGIIADFKGNKEEVNKRALINEYLYAGYSPDVAMKFGGSSIGIEEYKKMKAAVPTTSAGGASAGVFKKGFDSEGLNELDSASYEASGSIKSTSEASIDLSNNLQGQSFIVQTLNDIYQKSQGIHETDIDSISRKVKYSMLYENTLQKLDEQTRRVVEAMINAQNNLQASKEIKSGSNFITGVKYGAGGSSGYANGMPSEVEVSPIAAARNVITNVTNQMFYTQNNSSRVNKMVT